MGQGFVQMIDGNVVSFAAGPSLAASQCRRPCLRHPQARHAGIGCASLLPVIGERCRSLTTLTLGLLAARASCGRACRVGRRGRPSKAQARKDKAEKRRMAALEQHLAARSALKGAFKKQRHMRGNRQETLVDESDSDEEEDSDDDDEDWWELMEEDGLEEEEEEGGVRSLLRVQDVSWTPTVEGAGQAGRCAPKEVLKSVSWNVQKHDKVGLIGDNGAGKSAQLLMILGEVEPTGGQIVLEDPDMRIAYMQQEADLDSENTVFEELCSVFGDRSFESIDQDLEASAASEALMDRMSELLDERATVEGHVAEVDELIDELGLQGFRDVQVPSLSGGWQMRVALGKIMLSRPRLILLDEPTNHVDIETVKVMERFLRSQDVTMIIVSHDRFFLNQVCTKIVTVEKGCAKEYEGDYVAYLRKRDRAFTQAWHDYNLYMDSVKRLKKKLQKLEERFIIDMAAEKRRQLDKLLGNPVPKPEVDLISDFRFPCSLPALSRPEELPDESEDLWGEETTSSHPGPFVDAEQVAPVVLDVENMGVSFGEKAVLDDVTFSVQQGEKIALVGRNGCGKSTLVRAIMNDLEEGSVRGSARITDAGAAYFPQRLAEALNYESGSVKDALYMSCSASDIDGAGGMDAVLKRLRLDGITQEQPVSSLSGGEKARVAFARFLLQPVGLLILDEPTNHLDIATRELLEDAIKAYEGAALIVSHDRFFLREWSTRVIEVVEGGTIKNYESWDEYQTDAPREWQAAERAEVRFLRQDAILSKLWSKKKMARLRKREGTSIGLRRISERAEQYAPQPRPTREQSVEGGVENLRSIAERKWARARRQRAT